MDDYSHMTFVYFLRSKSEVDKRVRDFVEFVEGQTGDKVKHLRSDNGGEYGSATLRDHLGQQGIAFEKTEPYTPQQNGVAERTNSVLMNKARCMMQCMTVPTKFWADALATAVHIRNITPSAGLDWDTPKTRCSGKVPRIDHLRVLGCHAEVFTPSARRAKLDARTRPCMFVGYTETWRNYRFYDIETGRIIVSGNAKFYEFDSVSVTSAAYTEVSVFDTLLEECTVNSVDVPRNESEVPQVENDTEEFDDEAEPAEEAPAAEEPERRRSGRIRQPPLRLTYEHTLTDDEDEDVADMYVAHEPSTYEEATLDDDRDKWQAAMQEEIGAICLQGYEPLLPESMPYTRAILAAGQRLGIPTSLVTNGTYLDRWIDELAELQPHKITVSLDAADPATHDRSRGKIGAFEDAMRGLRLAADHPGLRPVLVLASILMPQKHQRLMGMPELAADLNVDHWAVTILQEVGKDEIGGPVGDRRRTFQDLLGLRREAEKHGVHFVVDDEFGTLSEEDIDRDVIDINALRIRRFVRPSGTFRLLPTGQCSMGLDILREVKSDTPRWIPGEMDAWDFIESLRQAQPSA
ncbi:MAG: radical SAM protein [Pseudomonadota bacterium]